METIGSDLAEMQRTPLAPSHVAAIREAGREVNYAAGKLLVRPGDPVDRFVYIEEGEIEVLNPFTGKRLLPATLGPTQFLGEISFLSGGNWSFQLRAARDTRMIEVPRAQMLQLMAHIPEMSDIIITVFAARRRWQLESSKNSLVLLGEEVDRNVRRIAAFASRNRIAYTSLALGSAEAKTVASSCAVSPERPAVIFGRDLVVTDPTPEKIARLLGFNRDFVDNETVDMLIVGAGPAGVSAGVYAAPRAWRRWLSKIPRSAARPAHRAVSKTTWASQQAYRARTSSGAEVQAMKFGTRFAMPLRVDRLEWHQDGLFSATFDNGQTVRAHAVVVATGVQYRRLPIERLAEFEGSGIYYAATENEARFCRDGEVVVIGGGNSAGQAAMFLSRVARHVRLLVRGKSLANSMSNYLSTRLDADPAISIEYGAQVVQLHGKDQLEAVTVRQEGKEDVRIPARGMFVMVGAAPNTGWLADLVQLDDKGFVLTGASAHVESPYGTSCPGIFAVGDVRAGSVKRVASSVGEGSVVISKVWEHVNRGKT